MDFFSTALVTIKQPSGFWASILNAFKNGTGTYILAVILVAVIVRFLFAIVDIFNKKGTMKNTEMMAKMKPEMDAIQKKYGYDQRLMAQKQQELYKKYQFNMMGTFFPMIIAMVLQLVVFLTLWNSLQAVSNFNIVEKYQNMKYVYANVVNLNDNAVLQTQIDYTDGDEVTVEIDFKNNQINIKNKTKDTEASAEYTTEWTNEEIFGLINTYVIETITEEGVEVANPAYSPTGYNEVFLKLAQESVEEYYKENQEGFLWVKNVYKPESPTSPLFSKAEVKKYMSNFYSAEEKEEEQEHEYEGKIYEFVVSDSINERALGVNGYYILSIIAVVVSFLSIWLSNKLLRNKNGIQKQSPLMYIIMPVIMGIFTFMYTSLFAIYIIIGQLIMMALTPITTLIVRKWLAHDEAKKKEKETVVVDYRRKDI